jgi:glutaredoxin 3
MYTPPTIIVYTRTFCIWCWKVKRLLERHDLAFEERSASSAEAPAWLLAQTGKKTVPQVFVDGEAIGGFEDTSAWLERARGLEGARVNLR